MSSSDAPGRAVEATVEGYDVGALPGVERVPPGTNLLVAGPAMSGKRDLGLDLLTPGTEDSHAVVISTDRPADDLLARYESEAPSSSQALGVDCSGRAEERSGVRIVSSPADLTGIGIGVVESTSALEEYGPDGIRVGAFSLSTILQYADADRVFNFLHVLTGRCAKAGYLSVFTLDPAASDDRTVNAIRSVFDGEVALRETDSGRELRVRGLRDAPGGWVAWNG